MLKYSHACLVNSLLNMLVSLHLNQISWPTSVYEALERHKNDDPVQVVPLTGSAIFNRFRKLQKKINMENFRFHDLRHFYASVMLALGIPDKYAMERIGHSSNAMLKNVYQHIINDKQSEFSILLDNYFSEQ